MNVFDKAKSEIKKLKVYINQIGKNYNESKNSVLKQSNISFSNGFWRYVDHTNKLATTGWKNKDTLIKNTSIIRFDKDTILLMKKRYLDEKD